MSRTRRTLPPAYRLPISWWELLKRTGRETVDDDCLSLAAQLAYYFFLALFPAVLFLLAVASFFPLQNLTADLTSLLAPFVSAEVLEFIRDQMRRLGDSDSGGILTVGALGAIWSSSAALVAIVNTLNKAYDVEDSRPWWKVRLLAIALTSFLAVFVLTALSLILAGPSVATYLGQTIGLGTAFEWTWKILQWPVSFMLVSTAIGLIYHFGPNVDHAWVWLSPGALSATVLWLVSSLALKFYVQSFADYNATYGAVGAIIIVLIWFYVSGLAILIGAEMDSEIVNARHRDAGLPVPPEAAV